MGLARHIGLMLHVDNTRGPHIAFGRDSCGPAKGDFPHAVNRQGIDLAYHVPCHI